MNQQEYSLENAVEDLLFGVEHPRDYGVWYCTLVLDKAFQLLPKDEYEYLQGIYG